MQDRHSRVYESQLDDQSSVAIGYDFERDNYLIVSNVNGARDWIVLSQDAIFRIVELYPMLLRYQSQCAPDGVGAEL